MNEVTVSPKYQIVVPREVRGRLGIKPGQHLSIIIGEGSITLLPRRPIEEMEGFLRGIKVKEDFEREPDRDL